MICNEKIGNRSKEASIPNPFIQGLSSSLKAMKEGINKNYIINSLLASSFRSVRSGVATPGPTQACAQVKPARSQLKYC